MSGEGFIMNVSPIYKKLYNGERKVRPNHMFREFIGVEYYRGDKTVAAREADWERYYRLEYLNYIVPPLLALDETFNRIKQSGIGKHGCYNILISETMVSQLMAFIRTVQRRAREMRHSCFTNLQHGELIDLEKYFIDRWLDHINFRARLLCGTHKMFSRDTHGDVFATDYGVPVQERIDGAFNANSEPRYRQVIVSPRSREAHYRLDMVTGLYYLSSIMRVIDTGRGMKVYARRHKIAGYSVEHPVDDPAQYRIEGSGSEEANVLSTFYRPRLGSTPGVNLVLVRCFECDAYMVKPYDDISWTYDQDNVGYEEDEDGNIDETSPIDPETEDYFCADKCSCCLASASQSAARGELSPYSCDAVISAGKPFLLGAKEKQADFFIGAELEVVAKTSTTREQAVKAIFEMFNHEQDGAFCIFKPDGSLPYEGFEIVTVPATLQRHREAWGKAFAAGIAKHVSSYPYRECGLHFHIGRKEAFTEVTLGRFMVFYNRDENLPFITAIAGRPIDRSVNYCASKDKKLTSGMQRNIRHDHYEATSISAKNSSKTVEVRVFKGNVAADGFFKCLDFVHASVMFARFTSFNKLSVADFLAWFDQPEQRTFYPTLYRFLLAKGYLDTAHVIKDEKKLQIEAA